MNQRFQQRGISDEGRQAVNIRLEISWKQIDGRPPWRDL